MQVELGGFSPVMFAVNGGMGRECQCSNQQWCSGFDQRYDTSYLRCFHSRNCNINEMEQDVTAQYDLPTIR